MTKHTCINGGMVRIDREECLNCMRSDASFYKGLLFEVRPMLLHAERNNDLVAKSLLERFNERIFR